MTIVESAFTDLQLFLAEVESISAYPEYSANCLNCDRKMVFKNGSCVGCGSQQPCFDSKPIDRREVAL